MNKNKILTTLHIRRRGSRSVWLPLVWCTRHGLTTIPCWGSIARLWRHRLVPWVLLGRGGVLGIW